MKRSITLLSLVGFLFQVSAFAQSSGLSQFTGVYRGLAPTDESEIGMGEIEISIQGSRIHTRMATGTKIEAHDLDSNQFEPITQAEVARMYGPGSSYVGRTVGFKRKGTDYPVFLFLRAPKLSGSDPKTDEYGLIVKAGDQSDSMGPTFLYSPTQIRHGGFDRMAKAIEAQSAFPRLSHGGRSQARSIKQWFKDQFLTSRTKLNSDDQLATRVNTNSEKNFVHTPSAVGALPQEEVNSRAGE